MANRLDKRLDLKPGATGSWVRRRAMRRAVSVVVSIVVVIVIATAVAVFFGQ